MRCRIALGATLLAALLLVQAAAAINKLYVNGVTGNDQNNCQTPPTACKTIGHAISLASPGDAIMVASATYSETLNISFGLGIYGAGASTTIIDGQGGTVVSISTSISTETPQVVLSGLTIQSGTTYFGCGGGIANSGSVNILNTVINDNFCTNMYDDVSEGGGICNYGTIVLNHSTVSNNGVGGNSSYGAGIANFGRLTIIDSTVRQNSNRGNGRSDIYGGGIYNDSTLVINRSSINENSTSGGSFYGGAALYNDNLGTATINNSTIYGNLATSPTAIGGITNAGTLTVSNSTISGNIGGGTSNRGTGKIQNSILDDNGGNCFGGLTSYGYNLSSDNTCAFSSAGDLNNTDPKLGSLGNNGGPTQTIPLLSGSPAIDAGNPNGCTNGQGQLLTTDQRGAPRPDHEDTNGCDMGAFERQSD